MNPFATLYNLVVQFFQYSLDLLFSFTGNYALAIMLMTFIFNMLFLPQRISQARGMKVVRLLQPKIDEINQRYKDDKEKASKLTMELYSKYNYNPLSACGPLLLQLPLFWAILEVFRSINFPEGAASAFLWIADISQVEPDFMGLPIKLLPLFAGAASYLQSRATQQPSTNGAPAAGDQMSQSMNVMLPIMMIFICWSQPASLALYWTTNQLMFGIQQLLISRFIKVEINAEDTILV